MLVILVLAGIVYSISVPIILFKIYKTIDTFTKKNSN